MTRTPKPPTPLLTTRDQTVPRRSEQGLDSGEQRPNIERRGGEEAVTWLRLSSAALRSSGTWLSAARRTTARLGRSMSTRAGSGVSCLKKARERRRATGGQNPSSGRRSRAPPPPPRETSGWREQERGARTWGWRSLFLFFLRRGVFDKGGGRAQVRAGGRDPGRGDQNIFNPRVWSGCGARWFHDHGLLRWPLGPRSQVSSALAAPDD